MLRAWSEWAALLWLLGMSSAAWAQSSAGSSAAAARSPKATPLQPAPAAEPSEASDTEEDDEEDEHTRLFFAEAGAGVAYVNMKALSYNGLYPDTVSLTGTGPSYGGALGMRLWIFTIGARVMAARYADFHIGTAVLEAGIRPKLGIVEPYLRLGMGYGWHRTRAEADAGAEFDKSNIDGFAYGLGLGVDFFIAGNWLAAGLGMDVDVLNLTRQGLDSADPPPPNSVDFREDGDAVGVQMRGQAHLGLHF